MFPGSLPDAFDGRLEAGQYDLQQRQVGGMIPENEGDVAYGIPIIHGETTMRCR